MPQNIGKSKNAQYLGKSKGGVSLATICGKYRLRVFNLVESNGQIDWELKHNVGLHPLKSLTFRDFRGFKKTWTLDDDVEDDDEYDDNDDDDDDDEGQEEEGEEEEEEGEGEGEGDEETEHDEGEEGEIDEMHMEWNSDNDNILNTEDDDGGCFDNLYFLGFHPYKEVVFLGYSSFIAVTYDLRSSKIQYLGKMRPKDYYSAHTNGMYEAYLYTPCMIGDLQKHVSMSHRRDSSILTARRLSMF
jgi:hypothetical protein